MLEDLFYGENYEFTDAQLEAQDMMKETDVMTDSGIAESAEEANEMLNQMKELSADELRYCASDEYARNGCTALRDLYLKLAKEKEGVSSNEISFGSKESYKGHSEKYWREEAAKAAAEGNSSAYDHAKKNYEKAIAAGMKKETDRTMHR